MVCGYDLKKFRAKNIVVNGTDGWTWRVTSDGLRAMTAYLTVQDKALVSLVNCFCSCGRTV
jgi:predicted MarR family transcription regulator